jgi:predicted transcriptional regulator
MHMLINIEDVEARFACLRLNAGDIAGLAGLHRTTWLRAAKGEVELRGRNVRKLYEALVAEEHRLLEHLIALHPEHAASLLAAPATAKEGEAA